MNDKNEIILYQPDEMVKLEVRMSEETVWLTQQQIALLFDCSIDNIGLHLKNIFQEQELDKNSTTEEISVVRKEGNRMVKRNVTHYNLDAILSVGYRVSSRNATKFRQWANRVLKEIYTQRTSPSFNVALAQHNNQYAPIDLSIFTQSHDRFLIIDQEVYHIGASIKDLGKKWFAFCKMELQADEIMEKLSQI